MKIALDAMGGDHAPRNTVLGALDIVKSDDLQVCLVGRAEEIEQELRHHRFRRDAIQVVDARDVIEMHESPGAVLRKKKNSSIHVCANLVSQGKADAVVSAGNTGAVMVITRMIVGSINGVDRPALAIPVPTPKGISLLLDVGANVDCKVHHLCEFAIMGDVFLRSAYGFAAPSIGLMNIGEEEGKGNLQAKDAYKILKSMPLNFLGNVEGGHLFSGDVDVVVCDGFTGNVALKVSESLVEVFFILLDRELRRSNWRKMVGFLAKPVLAVMHKRLDYAEYGGAPLLGIRGVAIICHGRSSPKAIANAVKLAANAVSNDFHNTLVAELANLATHLPNNRRDEDRDQSD